MSPSASTAVRVAARSVASSCNVELTNTRGRWSGVRIRLPPKLMDLAMRSGPVAQGGRVLRPRPLDHERVENPDRSWQLALHEGAVGLVERFEEHPESDGHLVPRDAGPRTIAEGVPLCLRERHGSKRDNLLLFVI